MNVRARVMGFLLIGFVVLHGAWALSQPPGYPPYPPQGQPRPYPGPGQPGVMPAPAQPIQNPQAKITPKLEAFAETKLLMEGLAQANFRGVEKLLAQKPADDQTWKFARGQALLLTETGNLLMLRPPRNEGEPVWFERATDYRKWSFYLAQVLAQKDYERSKAALAGVANTCNRCHQTFRVPVQIRPFEDLPKVSN